MTYGEAIEKAHKLAKMHDQDYFVVIEAHEYDVTDDFGLETFYAGISQDHILYCTADNG